jgi:hypothetical protein
MKKLSFLLGILTTLSVQAAPISPMEGFQYTDLKDMQEGMRVWRSMKRDTQRSSECFNRALAWVYDMDKDFGIKSRKLIIHYSAKYNKELDSKWGFHIAPLLSVAGQDYVFDREFMKKPEKVSDWVHHFKKHGEQKLRYERDKLVKKKRKYQKKLRKLIRRMEEDKEVQFFWDTPASLRKKIREIDEELVYLQVSETGPVEIKCKPITNIEELDYNLTSEWCYTQEVNMYYWGIPQLRLLNYGSTNVPHPNDLPYAQDRGRDFVRNSFDMEQVWDARAEAFDDWKEQWAREWRQKELEEERERERRRRARGW